MFKWLQDKNRSLGAAPKSVGTTEKVGLPLDRSKEGSRLAMSNRLAETGQISSIFAPMRREELKQAMIDIRGKNSSEVE